MTVDALYARFPELSPDLRGEPVVAEFAATFGELLAVARKPGNCSTGHDAANRFYLELLGPITYYGYGLATRERVIGDIRALLSRHAADPQGFVESLAGGSTGAVEVKGPGCE